MLRERCSGSVTFGVNQDRPLPACLNQVYRHIAIHALVHFHVLYTAVDESAPRQTTPYSYKHALGGALLFHFGLNPEKTLFYVLCILTDT